MRARLRISPRPFKMGMQHPQPVTLDTSMSTNFLNDLTNYKTQL